MLLAALLAAAPPSDLAAVGIVYALRPDRSVAVVRSGGRTRIAGVGEAVFGGRVAVIAPGRVLLDYDGRTVELRLPPRGPQEAAAVLRPAAAPSAAEARPELSAPLVLPRRDVERRLSEEIPRILGETALTPVRDEGQVVGFQITRLAPGTLLTEAGLRPGDVLTSVNGTAIDSMATLIGLWGRLQSESELSAVVLRGGQAVTLNVSLR
jgi:general secretion pathway protein C